MLMKESVSARAQKWAADSRVIPVLKQVPNALRGVEGKMQAAPWETLLLLWALGSSQHDRRNGIHPTAVVINGTLF